MKNILDNSYVSSSETEGCENATDDHIEDRKTGFGSKNEDSGRRGIASVACDYDWSESNESTSTKEPQIRKQNYE